MFLHLNTYVCVRVRVRVDTHEIYMCNKNIMHILTDHIAGDICCKTVVLFRRLLPPATTVNPTLQSPTHELTG